MVKNPADRVNIEFERKEIEKKVNRFGKKVLIKQWANAWTLVEKINDCSIKLVIGQINGGDKKFISIMSSDIKARGLKKKTKNPK